MAGQTPRFGLNYFGGDITGALGDDNDKFTGDDRLVIDRLLAALEGHSHHPTAELTPPSDPLTLGFDDSGGRLSAGETYHYLISFLNASGLETISGPETAISTPDVLPTPDTPSANTPAPEDNITGTLPPGGYFYLITGLRGGEESAASDPVSVTVTDDDSAVVLTLPELGDAEQYQVWRMADTDADFTRIGTTDTDSFTDDGSVPAGVYGDPANIVPVTNTGVDNYAVTIELGDDDKAQVLAGNIKAWRIYRSEFSGVYSAQSLVHEVIEHINPVDESTDLLTTWVDDGDPLLIGTPKNRSQEMSVAPFTFEKRDPLPATTGYLANYPIIGPDNALYTNVAGTWTPVTAGAAVTRGVAFYTGTGAPSPEPDGAQAGDIYLDKTTGDLYELAGS